MALALLMGVFWGVRCGQVGARPVGFPASPTPTRRVNDVVPMRTTRGADGGLCDDALAGATEQGLAPKHSSQATPIMFIALVRRLGRVLVESYPFATLAASPAVQAKWVNALSLIRLIRLLRLISLSKVGLVYY